MPLRKVVVTSLVVDPTPPSGYVYTVDISISSTGTRITKGLVTSKNTLMDQLFDILRILQRRGQKDQVQEVEDQVPVVKDQVENQVLKMENQDLDLVQE